MGVGLSVNRIAPVRPCSPAVAAVLCVLTLLRFTWVFSLSAPSRSVTRSRHRNRSIARPTVFPVGLGSPRGSGGARASIDLRKIGAIVAISPAPLATGHGSGVRGPESRSRRHEGGGAPPRTRELTPQSPPEPADLPATPLLEVNPADEVVAFCCLGPTVSRGASEESVPVLSRPCREGC